MQYRTAFSRIYGEINFYGDFKKFDYKILKHLKKDLVKEKFFFDIKFKNKLLKN